MHFHRLLSCLPYERAIVFISHISPPVEFVQSVDARDDQSVVEYEIPGPGKINVRRVNTVVGVHVRSTHGVSVMGVEGSLAPKYREEAKVSF